MSVPLSQPPISTPVVRDGKMDMNWIIYFQKAFGMLTDVGTSKTATSSTGSETLTYVAVGCMIFYSYTGLGGVTFYVNGNTIAISSSTTSQTTSSFIITG